MDWGVKMNILILDDCQIQLSALTRLLRQQGHSVVGTKSPTEAFGLSAQIGLTH